ncbi:hypothetical protein JTB14_003337 [Gonioctena quinquepunctata]|nr:hypothetical protein JTB14_003337 [Gonioctena quinquepunctata]
MSINKFSHAYSSDGDGGEECDVDLIFSYNTTDGNMDVNNLKICHVKPPTHAEDVHKVYMNQMIDRLKADFEQATNELLQGCEFESQMSKIKVELQKLRKVEQKSHDLE